VALWRRLLLNKDKWGVGAVDKALKATELKDALVTPRLAKAALIERL